MFHTENQLMPQDIVKKKRASSQQLVNTDSGLWYQQRKTEVLKGTQSQRKTCYNHHHCRVAGYMPKATLSEVIERFHSAKES